MSVIRDAGDHKAAGVDLGGRLKVFSIAESVNDFSTKNGDSYNINTGLIAYTGTSEN